MSRADAGNPLAAGTAEKRSRRAAPSMHESRALRAPCAARVAGPRPNGSSNSASPTTTRCARRRRKSRPRKRTTRRTMPGRSADNARHVIRDLGDGLRESLLLVEGVRCTACVWLIERSLGAMPGVVSVQVNAVAQRARVIWRDSKISLPQLLQALARTGYRALPLDARGLDDLRRRESRDALKRLLVAGFGAMQAMMYATAIYLGAADVARCVHARPAALARLAGGDPGGLLFGAAVLRGRLALARGAPRRHGRAGGAGHRGRLCRQPHRSAARQRRGVLRFDIDVRVLPARGPLPGNARATSRARSHRCAGPADAAVRRSAV